MMTKYLSCIDDVRQFVFTNCKSINIIELDVDKFGIFHLTYKEVQ